MGYRSDWQLTICASDGKVLNEMMTWMYNYAHVATPNITQDQRDIMDFILQQAHSNSNTCVVVFSESDTKCYDPWDDVVDDIRTHVEQNPELDFDYVRVGEEYDDVEVISGKGYISSGVNREICPPQASPIPSSKVPLTPLSITVSISVPVKEEEKCSCGRMKDKGTRCWWCGL